MSDNERDGKIRGDNPIQDPKDDVLGRTAVAESFVDHVLELDVSEGAVVGVFGPWGSGKTSFINLAKAKFKELGNPVFDFNPWMFSGTEQLVQRFFTELSSEFDIHVDSKRAELGKRIETLSPFVAASNPSISLLMKALGESLQDGKKGIKGQREKIRKALKREFRKHRGIVVLDDVDRLTTDEIRTIFKLVRLTANFPNLVYIVACDRFRVEEALGEDGLSGRAYLEKIFQLPYNLPEAPDQILQEQIDESVRAIHQDEKSTHSTPFDQEHWGFVFLGIVEPLIRNMRDVRRYNAAVRGTLISLRGQVELADVLGLEAVRIFLPDVFRLLPSVIDIITVASFEGFLARNRKDTNKELVSNKSENEEQKRKKIEELREVAKTLEREEIVDQMLHHLFKYFSQTFGTSPPEEELQGLLKRRRVAHEDILRLYMERVPGPNLPALEKVKEILASMNDREALDRHFRSFKPGEWPSIIELLSGFQDQFHPDHVKPGIIVLYNLFPDWPKNSSLRAAPMVGEVARSLLKQTPEEVEAIVQRVLPELTSLYSKTELVNLVGHQEGYRLISEEAEAEFSRELFNHAQSMSSDDLAQEEGLAWTLKFIKNSGHPVAIADSPKITFALLRSSLTTITITSPDRDQQLQGLSWGVLVDLYGSENILKTRMDSLNKQLKGKDFEQWLEGQKISISDAEAIVKLAEEYRDGRRL